MPFVNPFSRRKKGTKPQAWTDITYGYGMYESRDYQDTWTWPWAPGVPLQTRAAVTNAWHGNQLPGEVNFIPGVAQSKFLWNQPTFYQNLPAGGGFNYKIGNVQYNSGFNIEGMTQYSTANLQATAYQAWINRVS